ncbi:MAG: isoleucine--tRNA ligase [Ignavibacteriaceae bacterium]|jgi:isoleucyl-tRNA synthetase|nr:MAG: isoleucyl-tRNA synthetase [Chlorobi bacterium OLB4]MBW7855377.1 isoleucine--tRNA ligase [Ignavibacteria bacterium]MEB2329506.1 isoleucine--tRNA ligase [Ignavibacteriaceae bacterium]OQY76946.1 MAG: isoleucine--tRNA ligase [Ignavibacteriales bacterium UTCHB1]
MSDKFKIYSSLPELEKEVLEFWKSNDTFQKSILTKEGCPSFTFYEGPPTANGMPGIHHVISRTIKDLVCRYKTMSGFQVFRKAGWDTQGLPVEIEVEKTLGIKTKSEIENFGVIKFNDACKESIFKYLDKWKELTERMGYWIDLDDAYATYHNEYIESVWWALKNFFDAGLIYKGYKILPFCPICESSLSAHEVAQGYQDLKDPSVFVKFKITDGEFVGSDFLVWTTTPWTLPSNAALAVNPDIDYVKLSASNNENFILAKSRLEIISGEYKIEKEFKGSELEFIKYEPLFPYFNDQPNAFFVTLGLFVTTEDGTGIVHIAPAFGEDDYQTGLSYNLPVLQAVGRDGKFIPEIEKYSGKNFKEADKEIIDDLKLNGRLYRKEMFVHSYPHCWRHKVPLMYYATDSWFIRTTDYKDKMVSVNKEINWHPPEYGTGRFGNWLEENRDWALSRNRFWGTPLPIWFYKDNDGKEVYECIGSYEELKRKAKNYNEVYSDLEEFDVHKPFIDELILISETGEEMHRVEEVIDCWFDSGSMPFAQHHYPFENQELFKKSYPSDFIAEGLDQTRGWFYSLHAIGTFLFDKMAYKNLIVNGMILDKNGKKMSKSLGNAVDPFEMITKYGADVLRFYLIYSSPVGKSKLFNETEIVEVKNKFFDTLINTFRFYVIYSELTGFSYNSKETVPVNKRSGIDRWILSKMTSTEKEYFQLMDGYDITKASRVIFNFTIDELSNWYVRRNRKRFRNPIDDADMASAYQTLFEVLNRLLKLAAPFAPFISDKIFMELNNNDTSIHLSEFCKSENYIDSELELQMNYAQQIVYLVRAVRVKNNLKTRQPLRQIIIPVTDKRETEAIRKVEDIILEEVNVKELKIIEGDSDIIIKKAKPDFKSIGPKFGKEVKKVQEIIRGLSSNEISMLEKGNEILKDNFKITMDDIEILTEQIEGWIVETDGRTTIALDTKLDDELINEGFVREIINRIQTYRKTNNFDVNDSIDITYFASNKLSGIIKDHIDTLRKELIANQIEEGNSNNGLPTYKTDINGELVEFLITKQSK